MERKEFKKHLRKLSLIPITLLFLMAMTFCFQIYRQRQAALTVQHSDKVISDSTHLIKLLVDMETGFRGYLLSGQVSFLEPYNQASGSIQSEIRILQENAQGQDSVPDKVAVLETQMNDWMKYSQEFIHRRQNEPRFQPPFSDAEGKRRMDEMRMQAQGILQSEVEARNHFSDKYIREFRITIALIILLSIVAAIAITLLSMREARWIFNRFNESIDQLRKTGEQYRAVFEGLKDTGLSLIDDQGRITGWNPGAEALTGYSPLEIRGKLLSTLYLENDVSQQHLASILELARQMGRYESEEWRVRKDGTKFWANIVVTALWDQDGNLRGYTSLFRDFSTRRHREEERAHLIKKLEEGVRSRDDFLMLAGHELRTPMTSITLQIQTIQKTAARRAPEAKALESDEYVIKKKHLETFQRQTQRLNQLIESMFDLAKLHNGALPMKFEPVDLSEVTHKLLGEFTDRFASAGCPLKADIASGIHLVCDRHRIEQVLINLLTNALKYGCTDEIGVRLEKSDRFAVFTLHDAGPGIPQSYQKKIFDRYTRVEGINDQGGLGVGLYIAREIVEAHGGNISVVSEPGAGARFRVELPLDQTSAT